MNDRNCKPPKNSTRSSRDIEYVEGNEKFHFKRTFTDVQICVGPGSVENNTVIISPTLASEGEIDFCLDCMREEIERLRMRAKKALQRRFRLFPDQ